ncbi:MAG: TMEM165/GDT1 family protein [Actinomycetota bacterium]|nr:TMEM165/GDT1 family protein [Actinomycetota bacterium]
MHALLLSFAVIFLAELGDKSQLMALAFATRYPALPVLLGITLATAVVHGLSVAAGSLLGASLPTDTIEVAAGVAFVGFGVWTLRGDTLSAVEANRADRSNRSAVVAASTAFFLAELGDKTMLATMTLAATEDPWGTWAGSTLGMVAADALAIAAGHQLGARLPERAVKAGAALAFFAFGAVLVVSGLRG